MTGLVTPSSETPHWTAWPTPRIRSLSKVPATAFASHQNDQDDSSATLYLRIRSSHQWTIGGDQPGLLNT